MRHIRTQRIFSLISGLWVGGFITIGFLVVPVLFSSLGDRQVAGMIAANLFKTTAYIGVALSAFLMVMANHLVRRGGDRYRIVRWILLGMLACTAGSTADQPAASPTDHSPVGTGALRLAAREAFTPDQEEPRPESGDCIQPWSPAHAASGDHNPDS